MYNYGMKGVNRRGHWWAQIVIVALFVLLSPDVEAGGRLRDFSGDAMQRYNSRMMSSPVVHFPGLFGSSPWPYIIYPPAPMLTIMNIQIQIPELDRQPAPAPTPLHGPKFWTARCGTFVELERSSMLNLMEEERKPCSP